MNKMVAKLTEMT